MIYVPVVPPQPPSPRTMELADLLGRVIQEYEKHHPSVSGQEVRAAIQLAARSSKSPAPAVGLIAGGLAAVMGLGVFAFLASNGGQIELGAIPMVAVVVVLMGIVAGVALLKNLSGR